MRERLVLGGAVLLMLAGLTVWSLVARRGGGPAEEERAAYLASRDQAPPIGVDLHAADPRGAAALAAFATAHLAPPPLRLLLRRGDVPIVGVVVPGREGLSVWTALSAVRSQTHLTPVILGDGYAVAAHVDAARFTDEPVTAILRRARSLDLLERLSADARPLARSTLASVAPRAERYEVLLDPVMHLPIVEVAVALVPTDDPADVPAWLSFGNWRGCPEPALHVAMLAHLHQRVGAELVAISRDRIELRVGSPPTEPAERVALAELLARWAPGVLDRQRDTVEGWADTLIPAHSWSVSFARPR